MISDTCCTLARYENYTYKFFFEEEVYKVHDEYANGYWVFDDVSLLDELTEIRLIE